MGAAWKKEAPLLLGHAATRPDRQQNEHIVFKIVTPM
jgi:hypothetical protein